MAAFVPDIGDIVWLQFNPQAGHEQAGHRPALCLSPARYNRKVGLMLCCPMTTQQKGYPFEVEIAGNKTSVVLADQVRSVDWKARGAKRGGRVTIAELAEVRGKLLALIEPDP